MKSANLNTIATMVKQGLDIAVLPEELQDAINNIKDLTLDFEEEDTGAVKLAAKLVTNRDTMKLLYEALPETSQLKQVFLLELEKKRMFTEQNQRISEAEAEKQKGKLLQEYSRLETQLNRKIGKAKTEQDITNLQGEIAATDFEKYSEVLEENAAELFALAIEERKKELEPSWSESREADKAARQKAEFFRKQTELLESLKGLSLIYTMNFNKIMSEDTLQAFKDKNGGELPRNFKYLGVQFNRHTLYTDRYFIERPKPKKAA